MLSTLTRLAPAPGMCSLPSRDWVVTSGRRRPRGAAKGPPLPLRLPLCSGGRRNSGSCRARMDPSEASGRAWLHGCPPGSPETTQPTPTRRLTLCYWDVYMYD
eukprot:6439206-Pyramimonas_sp.AAC.1